MAGKHFWVQGKLLEEGANDCIHESRLNSTNLQVVVDCSGDQGVRMGMYDMSRYLCENGVQSTSTGFHLPEGLLNMALPAASKMANGVETASSQAEGR